MKEVMKYESMTGGLYDSPDLALTNDFTTLKDALERKIRFLSVLKEEGQFWEVKQALKAIYEKWQEYREIKSALPKKRGDVVCGVVEQGRSERPVPVKLQKAA